MKLLIHSCCTSCTVEVGEWISNFIPHFIMEVNHLSMLELKLSRVSKRGPGIHRLANVIMLVTDALVPNKRHAISNHHTDSTVTTVSHGLYHTTYAWYCSHPLQWRNNEHDGVSNHQRQDCLFNRSFRRRSKKSSKLRVTGLREGNLPVTGGFPSQKVSSAENVSVWWRHHD